MKIAVKEHFNGFRQVGMTESFWSQLQERGPSAANTQADAITWWKSGLYTTQAGDTYE